MIFSWICSKFVVSLFSLRYLRKSKREFNISMDSESESEENLAKDPNWRSVSILGFLSAFFKIEIKVLSEIRLVSLSRRIWMKAYPIARSKSWD